MQEVKTLVQKLKSDKREEAVSHRKVYRPWGSYECLSCDTRFQVKRIIVKPGARLSLQKHMHRAERQMPAAQVAAYDAIVGVLGLGEPATDLDDLAEPLADLAAGVGVPAGEPVATLEALIARRAQARAERAWALGDQIRDRLGALGIVLEDGADGTLWRRR